MPKVIYIQHNGTRHEIEAAVGNSVMQTAIDNMVPGILGDCGGCCSCATCHGYVDQAWGAKLAPRTEEEIMMLEAVSCVLPNSRLTCQIKMTPELDGLIVSLPQSQV